MSRVFDYRSDPPVLRCSICNGTSPLPMPVSLDQVIEAINQFEDQHRPCSSVAERRICNPEVAGSTPAGGTNG